MSLEFTSVGVDGAEPPQQILNLSLEDLLQVQVVSASKALQLPHEAPGSITSYSETDLHLLAYDTLAELANITPGYSAYQNIGEYTLETRGQMASGFDNNRHLVLVDGIPVNHVRADSAPVDHQLPLSFARQVEFLRGPASALYGVSAFYGVIDIRSREAEYGNDVQFDLGDREGERQLLVDNFFPAGAGDTAFHLGYYERDASAEPVRGPSPNSAYRNYDDQRSLFMYGRWQAQQGRFNGLSLGALYMEKDSGLGNFWSNSYSSERNHITWETLVMYARYDRHLLPTLELQSYLKYNQSGEAARYYDATDTLRSDYDYPFRDYEAQAELRWRLQHSQSLIAGVNLDARYGADSDTLVASQPAFTPAPPNLHSRSVFVQYQAEMPVLEGLSLTAGVRHDGACAQPDHYARFSPRLALVQHVTSKLNIKMLYGEALRGPSMKETGVNAEVRHERPDLQVALLKPETIRTQEFGPYYQADRWRASLTLFHNRTQAQIQRDWGRAGEYINSDGEISSRGSELEMRYQWESATLIGGYTWAHTTDDSGTQVNDIPQKRYNIGLLYDGILSQPLAGGVMVRLVDKYNGRDADGYTVVDINAEYRWNAVWSLALRLRNALDDDYYSPIEGNPALAMPGRSAMLSLRVRGL